ncbi:MAG: acetyl-CoA carboxylase biotin carboxylase subunit family protein [Planctomycetota bacterium]
MHVLFLAPDTHVYNHGFVQGLKSIGARVSAIGPHPRGRVAPPLLRLLDGYAHCPRLLEVEALQRALATLGDRTFDRIETIDEPLVEPAARLREALGLPGMSSATARLCRDKVAMKAFLREHGVPCAQSAGVASADAVRAFAEEHGYPLILKPIAGFNSLATFRLDDRAALDAHLQRHPIAPGQTLAVEEFVEGHEGFLDAIVDGDGVRFDFAAHYFPGCLEANRDRTIAPQIAVTNRIDEPGYAELRALGRRVVDALDLRHTATHLEWFFGPKGLKFSELGARPAGEKIWDMYRFANEFDVYREWALAVTGRPSGRPPSRRFACGSVQIRPDRDGRVTGHDGLDAAWRRCREFVYEYEIPQPGEQTRPLDKGWLVNTWFRLRHEDYDALRELMTFLGDTVKSHAR